MSKEYLLGLDFSQQIVKLGEKEYIVKEMDAETANKYESSLYTIKGDKVDFDTSKAKTKLVLLTLYDLDGKRVFEDKDYGHVAKLPAHIVDKVYQIASNLNNLNAEEVEKN